jgi:hypothetical protein
METLKKASFFAAATVAAVALIAWVVDACGFRSPASALLVNWLGMSWMAVLGQAVRFSFAPGYYHAQPFERAGRVYECLGIRVFKKLVRRGPLAVFSPTLRMPEGRTIAALQSLGADMQKAESGHVVIFALMMVYVGCTLLKGWLDAALWAMLFNILINGYPVMLQRYNRIKLQELIQQQNSGGVTP